MSPYGATLTYHDGALRVGCWNCDFVGGFRSFRGEELDDSAAEAILHTTPCAMCGLLELHAFGEFGCWPSEVGEPPCRRG